MPRRLRSYLPTEGFCIFHHSDVYACFRRIRKPEKNGEAERIGLCASRLEERVTPGETLPFTKSITRSEHESIQGATISISHRLESPQ